MSKISKCMNFVVAINFKKLFTISYQKDIVYTKKTPKFLPKRRAYVVKDGTDPEI